MRFVGRGIDADFVEHFGRRVEDRLDAAPAPFLPLRFRLHRASEERPLDKYERLLAFCTGMRALARIQRDSIEGASMTSSSETLQGKTRGDHSHVERNRAGDGGTTRVGRAQVYMIGRTVDAMEASAARIADAGGKTEIVAIDVRDSATLGEVIDHAASETGRLDVMVNNAGLGHPAAILDGELADWEEMIDVNVLALLVGCQAAVRAMRRSGSGGHIVNISSVGALHHDAGVYGATKAAVNYIATTLRQELEEDDIPHHVPDARRHRDQLRPQHGPGGRPRDRCARGRRGRRRARTAPARRGARQGPGRARAVHRPARRRRGRHLPPGEPAAAAQRPRADCSPARDPCSSDKLGPWVPSSRTPTNSAARFNHADFSGYRIWASSKAGRRLPAELE